MSEDAAVKEKVSSPEATKELQLSGAEVAEFAEELRENQEVIYQEYVSGNFEPQRYFSSSNKAELARDFYPAFISGAHKVANELAQDRKKPIPEGRFVSWVFLGPLSKIGLSRSKAERVLDGTPSEKRENLVKTQPLSENETANLDADEIRDVGRVFGRAAMYLNVAGRKVSEIHPNKGLLKETRNKWVLESKDKLRFLDTVLEQYYGDK